MPRRAAPALKTTERAVSSSHLKFYQQVEVPRLQPYNAFVQYYLSLDHSSAVNFWSTELCGSKRAAFPPLNDLSNTTGGQPIQLHRRTISLPDLGKSSITKASVLRAAWAIVLSRYCNTDDLTFGATVSGRQAPVPGLEAMAGLAIATVPVRIHLDKQIKASDFLINVQNQATTMIPFEQIGIQNIANVSLDAKEACNFSSLLVIQPQEFSTKDSADTILLSGEAERSLTEDSMQTYFNYPLVLICAITNKSIELRLFFDDNVLEKQEIIGMSYQIENVMQQLNDDICLDSVSLVGDWDVKHAINSQKIMPSTQSCIHWLIQDTARKYPHYPAISSHDGDLSYTELLSQASRLATKLLQLDIGPETLVPLCFPKSTFAVITMVAIEMAGGAFVPLDPKAPHDRLSSIIDDVKATIILTSPCCEEYVQTLGLATLVIDKSFIDALPDSDSSLQPRGSPHNASVVLFTSGSTGRPKGMVIQHDAICSSANAYGRDLQIGPGSRVFQFSAYTFDVGILDTLVTLMRGGCVCIPSYHDRLNNLAGAIRKSQANWVFLTPTVADLLNPKDVPTLRVVCLGGEAISQKTADRWKDFAEVHGLYGPAEASICAWNPTIGRQGKSTNLGIPLSSAFWVVEPDNINQLVPVGCVGELLIQGPMLARGYINVSKEQAANWIEDLDTSWLPHDYPRRAYRTGDLVRRNGDGTFDYLGRKDTQVKIHGQRVELGEIESRIHDALPANMTATVDLVEVSDGDNRQDYLLAFLWYTNHTASGNQSALRLVDGMSEEQQALISDVQACLATNLPTYMIPSSYFILLYKPEHTTSGKVDRRALKEFGRSLSKEDRVRFAPGTEERAAPTTHMELKLQKLWAEVLCIDSESISKTDSFLRIGGDSISAIRLTTAAQKQGMGLDVATIFRNPRLQDMANVVMIDSDNSASDDMQPLSMLSDQQKQEVFETLRGKYSLLDAVVEDAFPCTSLQEGLMVLAVKFPGSYMARLVYQIPNFVDIDLFKASWAQTAEICSTLRTRILYTSASAIQVVLRDEFNWAPIQGKHLSQVLEEQKCCEMGYGSNLSRYTLVEQADGRRYFFWTIHHAIYDGISKQNILNILQKVYSGVQVSPLPPFSRFIRHINSLEERDAERYWKLQLQNCQRATFPAINRVTQLLPETTKIIDKIVNLPNTLDSGITTATLIRAAWALTLARYCDTDDICFGTTISGRQAAVTDIMNMTGPTIATVPIRIRLNRNQPVSSFLHAVQEQGLEMIPYEQWGLSKIAKLNEESKEACQFSSLLTVQPIQHTAEMASDDIMVSADIETSQSGDPIQRFFSYPLIVQGQPYDNNVKLSFVYKSSAMIDSQAEALIHQLSHIICL